MSLPSKAQKGFTLLEVILVLAIIGGLASVILPNLRVTLDSEMSISIRNLSSQIRATYDNAVFSGRMHRMIFNIKTGEYWVEQAPPNFNGRPSLRPEDKNSAYESSKKSYLDSLLEKEKNSSKRTLQSSSDADPQFHAIRSIPVIQKQVFMPVKWIEVVDSIISKQKLGDKVIFAKFISGLNNEPYDFSSVANNNDPKLTKYGYIYFLSDGTITATSIYLAIKNKNNMVAENDLKYTLNINTLTGQIDLSEGFQDANFKLSKK